VAAIGAGKALDMMNSLNARVADSKEAIMSRVGEAGAKNAGAHRPAIDEE
jgi:hypothetical protein